MGPRMPLPVPLSMGQLHVDHAYRTWPRWAGARTNIRRVKVVASPWLLVASGRFSPPRPPHRSRTAGACWRFAARPAPELAACAPHARHACHKDEFLHNLVDAIIDLFRYPNTGQPADTP